MRGFDPASFTDLVSIHHRPLGSADGILRGHARHGECAYIAHYPAYWVLARSARVARRRPRGISGAAFIAGYAAAVLRRQPRIDDPELRRFVRSQLRQRVRREAGAAIAALLVSRRPRRA